MGVRRVRRTDDRFGARIMSDRNFRKSIQKAVGNPNLSLALERAVCAYAEARAEALEGVDFEKLRADLRAAKEASLNRIPELFDQFRREAERVGVQVYQAADAEEANRIVIELAQSHGARKIVKAKSMLSEEIELNRHLADAGLDVTETDLGEWICQLAGEGPSHFTAPAIHKTREEIADLFSKVVGHEVEPDISGLVEIARQQMRQAFIEADLGISGANIAIADTGTIVIVSNEGNARLVTSLPDVHIALVGYEKLVPSIDEATAIIKLLSKSGTGQKMTSYVSFITGPSRTSDIEKTLTLGCHGPRELHVVFVDNGRLDLIDDPEFRECLYCVKCGACLCTCPVYRSVGGHVFGHTYVGGIGAILTAFHAGLADAEDIVNICAACRRCMSYCPAKIDIPRMIVGLRRKLIESRGQPWLQRLILRNVVANPGRLNALVGYARLAQGLFLRKAGTIKGLPFPFSGVTASRNLPMLADKPLRERLPEVSRAKGKKLGTVAFYPGCVIDYIYPQIGEAVVGVLTKLGWQVRLPRDQGCCGIPALMKGDVETARVLARYNVNIADFESADYVIAACPTCAVALKEEFGRLLKPGTPDAERAARLASKIHDFAEFLINIAQVTGGNFRKPESQDRVTYHDPCHAKHSLGISAEPRKVLELAGYEVVEMPESDECCGFAGSYSISYPEISGAILERKLKSVLSSGASVVVTACPGCLLQLRGGLEKAGSETRAVHLAEAIAERVKR